MEKHSDDLHDVSEGDEVTITPAGGTTMAGECVSRSTQHADPRSGEVRETESWEFVVDGDRTVFATVTNGLKSSPDDPDFPIHSEMYDPNADESLGYIEKVQIHE
jgi:hypothetical protein